MTVGVKDGKRYVLSVVNLRMDLDATENEIRRQHALQQTRITATLVEDKALGPAIVAHLKQNLSGVIAGVNPREESHEVYGGRTGISGARLVHRPQCGLGRHVYPAIDGVSEWRT